MFTDATSRVLVERHGPVAVVTLNQPKVFNAFDEPTIEALWKEMRALARDDSAGGVVLAGAGKAFCAGGNLSAVVAMQPDRPGEGFYQVATLFHQCVQEIRTMPKAVIAAIHGPAAGGGFSLALACDLRVMAESAFLQQAYTSNGLSLDGGGTFTLPRLVGLARALEIALLDDRLSSSRALELGLVTKVVPDGAALTEAIALADRLARMPRQALGRVKALLNESFDSSLERQMERERLALSDCANGAEGREGLNAFLQKRKPDFVAARS